MFEVSFKIGNVFTNNDIVKEFQCGNMGGMRLSKRTKSLILITDHTKSLYDDIWQGNILHYTGMGKSEDQNLGFSQNKTLARSNDNDLTVYLFEVIIRGQYVFRGAVKLIEQPYQSEQIGENGKNRKVWIFPLRLLNKQASITPEELENLKESLNQKVKKMDIKSLEKVAKGRQQNKTSFRIINHVKVYVRDPVIAQYAKERASGRCQLCDIPAPFKDKEGQWYLESHHIDWLSDDGSDTVENTSALCPNCHRKMHILNSPDDVALLKRKNRKE